MKIIFRFRDSISLKRWNPFSNKNEKSLAIIAELQLFHENRIGIFCIR